MRKLAVRARKHLPVGKPLTAPRGTASGSSLALAADGRVLIPGEAGARPHLLVETGRVEVEPPDEGEHLGPARICGRWLVQTVHMPAGDSAPRALPGVSRAVVSDLAARDEGGRNARLEVRLAGTTAVTPRLSRTHLALGDDRGRVIHLDLARASVVSGIQL